MIALSLLGSTSALAASLDLLEVGGAWGTPGGTNPSALWWNPAGLAFREGHQLLIEGAPTLGGVTAKRDNPDYGPVDPGLLTGGDGTPPDRYDYGGTDRLSYVGVVPFVGISSDLGLDGLAVGAALAVPTGKGASLADIDDPTAPNRFQLRKGSIQTVYTMLGASLRVLDRVAVGVSGSLLSSSYYADTDTSTYPDLAAAQADFNEGVIPPSFQAGYAELPDNAVRSVFDLRDTAFTFGAGIHVRATDQIAVAVSYNHGVRLDHAGDVTLSFACPPTWDPLARAAAMESGTCNTLARGTGAIGYRLPSRVHLGIVLTPTESLRLEAMGGLVFWSTFGPYDIRPLVPPTQFPDAINAGAADVAARQASTPRQWARDTRDTFWAGVDTKVSLGQRWIVGGRALYDRAAIGAQSVSANNYDADALLLSGMVDVTPATPFSITVSYTHQFLARRTVTSSPFGIGVDASEFDPAYFYPSANGTYTGSIDRFGLAVRARLP